MKVKILGIMGLSILVLSAFAVTLVTAVPQQPYTILGNATLDGVQLTAADTNVVISAMLNEVEIVNYTMGSNPQYGDTYALTIPLDTDCTLTTAACPGDIVRIYINGIEINEGNQTVGDPGGFLQLNISATTPPPITVTLTAAPTTVSVGETTTITVNVTEAGTPKSNASVNFTATAGNIPANKTTDANGTATVTYTAPTTAGTYIVTAEYSGEIDTVNITITPGPIAKLMLTAYPSIVLVNNTSTIIAKVTDQYNNPVENEIVNFTATAGDIPANETTGADGTATVTYTAPTTAGTYTVTATSTTNTSVTNTTEIKVEPTAPASVTVTADPQTVYIGGANSTVNASVKDQYNNPVPNKTVAFSILPQNGTITPSAVTNENGVATAQYKPPLTGVSENITVTATADNVSGNTNLTLRTVIVTLTAPTTVGVGETTTITVNVTEEGTPKSNATVNFTATAGNVPANETTDVNGTATVTYTAPTTSGNDTVTAEYSGVIDTVNITITPGPVAKLMLTADPSIVLVNKTSTITAKVTDQYNNPIENEIVNFTAAAGDIPANKTTGADGTVAVIYTAPATAETYTVTATSTTDTSVTNTIEIKVESAPRYEVNLTIDKAIKKTIPNINATYVLTVTNTGNTRDTFNLTVDNINNAEVASLSTSSVTLNGGGSTTVSLNVGSSTVGTYNVNVTATSANATTTRTTTTNVKEVIITDYVVGNGTRGDRITANVTIINGLQERKWYIVAVTGAKSGYPLSGVGVVRLEPKEEVIIPVLVPIPHGAITGDYELRPDVYTYPYVPGMSIEYTEYRVAYVT